jgi:hypothetical protein
MTAKLEAIFPGLVGSGYRVTSPAAKRYNCIAWAAGDPSDWWWPGPEGTSHGPAGVPRELTLDAFRAMFASLGYAVCDSADAEAGFEKIAVYATADGVPRHAARQLSSARWTSKLGRMEDIEHELSDLTSAIYGAVALLMKRPQAAAG